MSDSRSAVRLDTDITIRGRAGRRRSRRSRRGRRLVVALALVGATLAGVVTSPAASATPSGTTTTPPGPHAGTA